MPEAQLPANQPRSEHTPAVTSLQNSRAPLQWACDSAQGKTKSLDWVDSRIEGFHRSFAVTESRGHRQYRHLHMGHTYLVQCVCLLNMLKKMVNPLYWKGCCCCLPRWSGLIATRRYYWSPMSPVPQLLVTLVEAMESTMYPSKSSGCIGSIGG